MGDGVLKWGAPLGFLALLGLIVLIIIYLLKPNFQQKMISSSFVWKLSLKYRKRRLPVSKVRNLIIFICQILIITMCAFAIATPLIVTAMQDEDPDQIIIIDAAASMMAHDSAGVTRFDRAKQKASDLIGGYNGAITLIVANDVPHVLTNGEFTAFRSPVSERAKLVAALASLECTYGTSDLDSALALAQTVIDESPMANITIYTATECGDYGDRIKVERISDDSEYNAAVLGLNIAYIENLYVFEAEVACYLEDRGDLEVFIEVYGVNADGENPTGKNLVPLDPVVDGDPCVKIARCFNNTPTKVIFADLNVASFDYVRVSIREDDSFTLDNAYYAYGGTKEVINVLYSSSLPNIFYSAAVASIRQDVMPFFNVKATQHLPQNGDGFVYSGYDFYIFEHRDMPEELPTDGIVLVANPKSEPDGLDVKFVGNVTNSEGGQYRFNSGDSIGTPHPILNGVRPENIAVSQYLAVDTYDEGYEPILFTGPTGSDPVVLVKDEPDCKMVVFAFDVNFADFSMLADFPIMMLNIFNYFLPYTAKPEAKATSPKYVYDVGQGVLLNARGETLTVSSPDGTSYVYDEFTEDFTFLVPGRYEFSQELLRGETIREFIFVKVAREQSDFSRVLSLRLPYFPPPPLITWSLLVYLASLLFALLFVERLLQSRELI